MRIHIIKSSFRLLPRSIPTPLGNSFVYTSNLFSFYNIFKILDALIYFQLENHW